ncbi:hypothetical protein [Synechococcus sp. H65.1]|uniref:hypothetical protein n=1 Tax=unclassified Synechococcus TaxID=2626047 RepID=UPI0039C0F6A6
MSRQFWRVGLGSCVGWLLLGLDPCGPAWSLPPASEIPEEVLRAQPSLDTRSPVDNQPLSATEAQELQAQLATRPATGSVSPRVERLIFLLKLRKGVRDLFPFLLP